LSLTLTGSIFALLPILHILPDFWKPDPGINTDSVVKEIPPVVIEPEVKPPEPKEKLKAPEMERELQKIDLRQLEVLLNTTGDGSSYLDIGDPAQIFMPAKFEDLYDLSDLDRKPKALFQVEPVFPYNLKNQRIEGWVILEWIITSSGRVTQVKAIQYSHREFVQPAIDSISKSKWEPGEVSKEPVNTRVRQKISFNL